MLVRARNAPLHIISIVQQRHPLEECLSVLLQHMSRAESVVLMVTTDILPQISPALSVMPKLRCLRFSVRPVTLTYDRNYILQPARESWKDNRSLLETLHLFGFSYPNAIPLFLPGLKDLALAHMSDGPSARDLLRVLRGMPLLETLRISSGVLSDDNPPGNQIPLVSLRHLRNLDICGSSIQCGEVLDSLRFPSTVHMTVQVKALSADTSLDSVLNAIVSKLLGPTSLNGTPYPSFQTFLWISPTICACVDVEINLGSWPYYRVRDYNLCLDTSRAYRVSATPWARESFRPVLHHIHTFIADITTSFLWSDVSNFLATVEHLKVVGGMRGIHLNDSTIQAVLTALDVRAQPQPELDSSSGTTSTAFHFPRLRSLALHALWFRPMSCEPDSYHTVSSTALGLVKSLDARKAAGIGIETLTIRSAISFVEIDADALGGCVGRVDWDHEVKIPDSLSPNSLVR